MSRSSSSPSGTDRERESRQDDQVRVKLHALDPADAKHREAEAVLQAAEFALYGGAPLVERGPFRGAAFDRRFGLDAALAERDDW